jgi:hypothetical protein
MKGVSMRSLAILILTVITFGLIPALSLQAEEHLVTPADLQKVLSEAASKRQENLAKVNRLLSREPVRKALDTAGLHLSKVEKAVPQLNDEELARLASRADRIETDLAAGALTNEQLTYIVIALVTAVVILIIVAA